MEERPVRSGLLVSLSRAAAAVVVAGEVWHIVQRSPSVAG